jgi:hypothetical protein
MEDTFKLTLLNLIPFYVTMPNRYQTRMFANAHLGFFRTDHDPPGSPISNLDMP